MPTLNIKRGEFETVLEIEPYSARVEAEADEAGNTAHYVICGVSCDGRSRWNKQEGQTFPTMDAAITAAKAELHRIIDGDAYDLQCLADACA